MVRLDLISSSNLNGSVIMILLQHSSSWCQMEHLGTWINSSHRPAGRVPFAPRVSLRQQKEYSYALHTGVALLKCPVFLNLPQ